MANTIVQDNDDVGMDVMDEVPEPEPDPRVTDPYFHVIDLGGGVYDYVRPGPNEFGKPRRLPQGRKRYEHVDTDLLGRWVYR